MIIAAADKLLPAFAELFNGILEDGRDGLPYCHLAEGDFQRVFGGPGRANYYASENGRTVGFLSGSVPGENGVSYLSYVGVVPEYRGRGIASALLSRFERDMKEKYSAARIDTVFYDSSHLPWIIPGSGDGHPCAPGTPSGSAAEKLLLSRGYAEWTAQISYYRRLCGYEAPEGLDEKRKRLRTEGIDITLYDPDVHRGLPELFDAIRNPGWKAAVLSRLDRPVIVAADMNRQGLVVGYTGPLSVEREGSGLRGCFHGIGTHPDYRGRGIATQIFCEMCRIHKASGADFMSLYTGETNPARHVYEAAGLFPVARWSNLRLVLKDG